MSINTFVFPTLLPHDSFVTTSLQKGDKILLPPSAFDTLARLQVDYPMLFRLHAETNHSTHCGVLEFTAEEGSCYIPYWMMQNLFIQEGDVITVTNVSLPKATMIKLKPQHVDFLEISNPKAVLEFALRNFSCVTKGDVIQIPYNNKNYQFELQEVQPQDAACIIETDCNLEFDAPVGYKEPAPSSMGSASLGSLSNQPRSECPSPTTASSASSVAGMDEDNNNTNINPTGIRIVNGKIIRPDDRGPLATRPIPAMMAEKTGATGVQPNAAIPLKAPEGEYWAVNVGESGGARLDGKPPAQITDAAGNVMDVRKVRAEAAARRAEAAAKANSALATTAGKTIAGEVVEAAVQVSVPVSKRKTKVGSKYSRLKQSGVAFQGSANTMN
jgi:ubiquitin fusion degradation protein 1